MASSCRPRARGRFTSSCACCGRLRVTPISRGKHAACFGSSCSWPIARTIATAVSSRTRPLSCGRTFLAAASLCFTRHVWIWRRHDTVVEGGKCNSSFLYYTASGSPHRPSSGASSVCTAPSKFFSRFSCALPLLSLAIGVALGMRTLPLPRGFESFVKAGMLCLPAEGLQQQQRDGHGLEPRAWRRGCNGCMVANSPFLWPRRLQTLRRRPRADADAL